jgi:DNA-binding beta-propeller fold protein YncE
VNKVVDLIQICQGPSHMALRQLREADASGTPLLRTRLYVACFTSNQVMIVDPDRPGVDETILVGRGPNELAFNWTGDETPAAHALPIPRRRRAYVTDYSESTISVLDLEPGSPTENRLIARIGLPVPARRP